MKNKVIGAVPALCFLSGFLICALLIPPDAQINTDGGSYDSMIGSICFWEIFLNNAWMCFLFMMGCGIGSSIMLLVQGLSFGGTYAVWMLMGNSARNFWLLFLPHVFFEFIAMALAGYLGFRLLAFLLNKTGQSLRTLIRDNRTLLVLMFSTVLVAALVECYATPMIYRFFA